MGLTPLAELISAITVRPDSEGISRRKKFNQDPLVSSLNPKQKIGFGDLQSDEQGAFLGMKKRDMIIQVLMSIDKDPMLRGLSADTTKCRDFVLWLYEYLRWDWDPSEEGLLDFGLKPPNVQIPQYSDPQCQVYRVDATRVDAKNVKVEVYAQGLLGGGRCRVRITPPNGGPLDLKPQAPDDKSTFRWGRITFDQLALQPGDHTADVAIDLGNGKTFPIGSAKFKVA